MPLDMNPQVRAQWCAALRSGDYQQGQKTLRAGDSYCCLGVLCDLAVKAGIISGPLRVAAGEWCYGHQTNYLPERVQAWAALPVNDPEVCFRGAWTWLAAVNDGGATFAEIADLIDGGAS